MNQKDNKTSFEHNANTSDLVKATTSGNGTYEYQYDSKHNLTKVFNSDIEINTAATRKNYETIQMGIELCYVYRKGSKHEEKNNID